MRTLAMATPVPAAALSCMLMPAPLTRTSLDSLTMKLAAHALGYILVGGIIRRAGARKLYSVTRRMRGNLGGTRCAARTPRR